MKKILVLFGLVFVLSGCGQESEEIVLDELLIKEEVEKAYNDELIEKENDFLKEKSNELDDWQTYVNEKITFKYPKGWFVEEEKSTGRIYIKNTNIANLSKANMPKDFQMFWISKEKTLPSVMSTRSPEYVNAPNGLKIKTYKMNSTGGPLLEAYWKSNSGEEYYATNSSEVSDELQNKMMENLKKVLSTFEELDKREELSDECEKDGRVYFDIPEAGISVLVNKKIRDELIYSPHRGYGDGVAISSKKLVEVDSNCSVDDMKGLPAFGIYKISEVSDYPDVTSDMLVDHTIKKFNLNSVETKQIGDNVFIFNKRSYKCSNSDYEDYFIKNSLDVMVDNAECIKEIK